MSDDESECSDASSSSSSSRWDQDWYGTSASARSYRTSRTSRVALADVSPNRQFQHMYAQEHQPSNKKPEGAWEFLYSHMDVPGAAQAAACRQYSNRNGLRDSLENPWISASGVSIDCLYYNLRHAVEHKQMQLVTDILRDLFATFIVMNRRLFRFLPVDSRETLLHILPALSGFENDRALAFHQRLHCELMYIFMTQIGLSTPTAIAETVYLWNLYQEQLFSIPSEALVALLNIGGLLCGCKKDPTIGFVRTLFARSAAMVNFRDEAVKDEGLLLRRAMLLSESREMYTLLTAQYYMFKDRQRIKQYWRLSCAVQHPEYICQGGAMDKAHLSKFMAAIRDDSLNPVYHQILTLTEQLLAYLNAGVNHIGCTDLCEEVQLHGLLFASQLGSVLLRESGTNGADQSGGILTVSSNIIHFLRAQYIDAAPVTHYFFATRGRAPRLEYGVVGTHQGTSNSSETSMICLLGTEDAQDAATTQNAWHDAPAHNNILGKRRGGVSGALANIFMPQGRAAAVSKAQEALHPSIETIAQGHRDIMAVTRNQFNAVLEPHVRALHKLMACFLNRKHLTAMGGGGNGKARDVRRKSGTGVGEWHAAGNAGVPAMLLPRLRDSGLMDYSQPVEVLAMSNGIPGAYIVRACPLDAFLSRIIVNTTETCEDDGSSWEAVRTIDGAELIRDALIASTETLRESFAYFVGPISTAISNSTATLDQIQQDIELHHRAKMELGIAPLRTLLLRHVQLDQFFQQAFTNAPGIPGIRRASDVDGPLDSCGFEIGRNYAWAVYIVEVPSAYQFYRNPDTNKAETSPIVTVPLGALCRRIEAMEKQNGVKDAISKLRPCFINCDAFLRIMIYLKHTRQQKMHANDVIVSFRIDILRENGIRFRAIKYYCTSDRVADMIITPYHTSEDILMQLDYDSVRQKSGVAPQVVERYEGAMLAILNRRV